MQINGVIKTKALLEKKRLEKEAADATALPGRRARATIRAKAL